MKTSKETTLQSRKEIYEIFCLIGLRDSKFFSHSSWCESKNSSREKHEFGTGLQVDSLDFHSLCDNEQSGTLELPGRVSVKKDLGVKVRSDSLVACTEPKQFRSKTSRHVPAKTGNSSSPLDSTNLSLESMLSWQSLSRNQTLWMLGGGGEVGVAVTKLIEIKFHPCSSWRMYKLS